MKTMAITCAGALVAAIMGAMWYDDHRTTQKVKSGEALLVCHMSDSTRVIAPERVLYFADGRWYFRQGSATQCYLQEKGE